MKTARISAGAFLALILFTAAGAGAAAGNRMNSVDDSALDRNGDGFQDVIVDRRTVHFDIDFDGRFDYSLSLKLSDYTTADHSRYLASGCSPEIFTEATTYALDQLCATDREAARWIENHFSEFLFYRDGYSMLSLFTDSPVNDGRLASPKERGEYGYVVSFNPDGAVRSVARGTDSVKVAEFDYEQNSTPGRRVTLPPIESREDLEKVRAELDALFPAE